MFVPLEDKAGLSWKGFNVPTDLGEDKPADDIGREETQRKKLERGWSGKTWPGRTVGPPVTADGGLQMLNIFLDNRVMQSSFELFDFFVA